MRGDKNHFRKGLFISIVFHLLLVALLALGVGKNGQISPERSIEVSLSTDISRGEKKAKPAPSAHSQKPREKTEKIKKTPEKQTKPSKKEKAKPKQTAKKEKPKKTQKTKPKPSVPPEKPTVRSKETETPSKTTAEKSKPSTEKSEPDTEKKGSDGKEEVIRNIRKESVLSGIRKSAESGPPETASQKSNPGLISLVLDVYYSKISKQIKQNLILPLNIDSDMFLAAQVNFYMSENGEVYNVGIERSSGNVKFDSYCVKAVNNASPLSPPPSELRDRIRSEFFVISCESKK